MQSSFVPSVAVGRCTPHPPTSSVHLGVPGGKVGAETSQSGMHGKYCPRELAKIHTAWPELRYGILKGHLVLWPTKTLISATKDKE